MITKKENIIYCTQEDYETNKLTVDEVKARLSKNDIEYNLLSKKALKLVLNSTVKTYK